MHSNLLTDMEIRERFFALLDRRGWGVTEAARELGVPQPTVSQWKNGSKPIPPEHREALAARCGEPLGYLFFRDPGSGDTATRDRLIAGEWMVRIGEELRQGSPEGVGASLADLLSRPPASGGGSS
jgi:transcriptional regulator with XRE-family HTH domain